MGELAAPLEVVKLIKIFDIVALEVKYREVLDESNVEQFINFIVTYIQFFELFESLDTLDLFELAASNVEHSHILERCSNVPESRNYRVIQFQVL